MGLKKLVIRDVRLEGEELVISVAYMVSPDVTPLHTFEARCPRTATLPEMKAAVLAQYDLEEEAIGYRRFIGSVIEVT